MITSLKLPLLCTALLFSTCINTSIAQSKAAKTAIKEYKSSRENFLKIVENPKTVNGLTRGSYGVYSNYERKFNAKNNYCSPEDYKIPKKVALLTFYIEDKDYKTYTQSGYWRTTWSAKASAEKVNIVTQRIYEGCISDMKAAYLQKGMELQTPDEYLNTPELKETYHNFPLPNLESRFASWDLSGSGSATPEGYRFFPYNSVVGAQGGNFFEEKMAFFQALGFEAFIIVAVRMSAANSSISGINTTFMYHNPGWKASGKSGMIVGYQPYNTAVMSFNFEYETKGVFIKKQEDYTNEKGKPDVKLVIEDVDPNVGKLVTYTTKRLAEKAIPEILKAPKQKKKKK
ncbi:MAG: hypothetical protein ACPGD5_01400 [Salibacteraceae bacterium]